MWDRGKKRRSYISSKSEVPDHSHGNYMSTTCLYVDVIVLKVQMLAWQWCSSWFGRYFCVSYGWCGWASDPKWAMLCLNEWCVTKVGAWDDKQNLLKGCENGRSSKLTLVWADWSIYLLDKSWSIMMSKVLERVDLIEKCTGMVLETWVARFGVLLE